MEGQQRFTDEEVRLILARAAERHEHSARGQAVVRHGLTLTELESVAAEAGIDPVHVAAAARELDLRREQGLPAPLASNPDELAHVRVLPGPVDDELWGRMVGELRSTFGVSGVASQFGRIREWSTTTGKNDSSGTPAVRVRVEPDGSGTSISIRRDLKGLRTLPLTLGGTFATLAVVFAILLTLATFEPGAMILPGLFGGAAAVSFVGARLAYKGMLSKSDEQFRRVLDAVELAALKAGTPPTV